MIRAETAHHAGYAAFDGMKDKHMTGSETLADWKQRNETTLQYLSDIAGRCEEQAFYQRPASAAWSAAQIVEHMVIVNRIYLQEIQGGMERVKKVTGDAPLRHTLFGRLLIRASGPNGNAPSPKVFIPSSNPIWQEVFAEWREQQTHLLVLLEQATRADLSGTYVKNPVVRVLRMNLADCFEIMTAHAERHVGQIQERLLSLPAAKSV